jgi:arylsulfatase A-like enzyme
LDDAVGAILKELRKYNLEEDTLIFFLGDNGGPTWNTTCRNRPLRGFKFGMYEGGIRVPFIMQWKRRLPQGMVYTKPVSSLDICTTAIAAAGGTVQESAKLDGVNLLPYLTGENPGCPHDLLFWRRGPNYAVRMGDWKLISMIGEPVGLFNLAEDISEKINLADRKPEKRKELQTAWDAWNAELIDPLWISRSISRKMMNK